MMHWILQDNLFQEKAYQDLLNILERFQISHSIHKVIPFIGELMPYPSLDTNNVICMGSYSLRHFAKKMGWKPSVFDLEPYHFLIQQKHWNQFMMNNDSLVGSLENVFFPTEQNTMFIRPIEDSKVFSGQLIEQKDFEDWKQKILQLDYSENDISLLNKDTLIQLCLPKQILSEHRFWIVKGEIVTASTYKIGHTVFYKSDVDHRFYQFVQQMVDIWQPLDAFVIDVAEIEKNGERELKIVEINTLNAAGFYAADMQKLVFSLEENFSTD